MNSKEKHLAEIDKTIEANVLYICMTGGNAVLYVIRVCCSIPVRELSFLQLRPESKKTLAQRTATPTTPNNVLSCQGCSLRVLCQNYRP